MKVATEIAIQAQPEKIWQVLTDFDAYPEWNRFIKTARGRAAPDETLEVRLEYPGQETRVYAAKVTGFIAPKYLSWAWAHKLGSWWMQAEHVFRIKQNESGKVVFHQEAYYTGMGLRFGRKSFHNLAHISMEKMSDDLKERVEASK